MKLVKILVMTAYLLCSVSVYAMTGLDYIKLGKMSAEKEALEPIIINFVSRGFKNVPDWIALKDAVRGLVLKNGYGNKSLESISEEAASQLGMSH